MISKRISPQEVESRLETYAAWVAELRSGHPVPALSVTDNSPISRLARELDQLAEALARRERELHRLFEVIETIEQGVLIDDVLNRIFDGFIGVIPFDRIGCAFLTGDGARLTAFWARSNLGPARITKGYTQRIAGSSLEPILKSGAPRILNDLERYLEEKPGSDSTRRIVEEGGRSSFTCPLMVNFKPIGVLFFTSREKNTYKELHQTIFLQIASQLAIIISKSRQYEEILERNRELAKRSRKLETIASVDPLTGILNRRAITEYLEGEWKKAREKKESIGIILADIDHFKTVNDSLGHPAGDQALKIFAKRLSSVLRPNDRLGRYGGEEFLIVLGNITGDALAKTAERLRDVVASTPFALDAQTRTITASFGAVLCDGCQASPEAAIAEVDRALYVAKETGRNKVVSADQIRKQDDVAAPRAASMG